MRIENFQFFKKIVQYMKVTFDNLYQNYYPK